MGWGGGESIAFWDVLDAEEMCWVKEKEVAIRLPLLTLIEGQLPWFELKSKTDGWGYKGKGVDGIQTETSEELDWVSVILMKWAVEIIEKAKYSDQ